MEIYRGDYIKYRLQPRFKILIGCNALFILNGNFYTVTKMNKDPERGTYFKVKYVTNLFTYTIVYYFDGYIIIDRKDREYSDKNMNIKATTLSIKQRELCQIKIDKQDQRYFQLQEKELRKRFKRFQK